MKTRAFVGLLVLACGGSSPPPAGPLSAAQHLDHARRDEAEATAHHVRASEAGAAETALGGRPACVDTATDVPPPESGGERLEIVRPCFTAHERSSALERAEAHRHEAAARDHRREAAGLLEAERHACAGIGVSERGHSPFWHREDLAAVSPIVEGGHVRGAEVRFRRVPGLTEDWLRRAIACHQARAAVVGFDPAFMPYCPLVLEGVTAEVHTHDGQVVVDLRAPRAEIAAALLGRAEDLMLGAP